ncbi:unnamed protein product [Brassicogethes aeneus]|uniref:Uncharacterized protein n=1 Tax=Brassicogethes aeneus TaxID=1431903 RepID=A0A9P0AU90_BRAAE|nr:unnamed protein product [Brassicogethes aeneus]
MNAIVPDQILDKMICSKCSKYLSVLPVRIYSKGEKKCGRCIKKDDQGVPLQVNTKFHMMQFKCSNRYEGCTALLLPKEVRKHEVKCVSKYSDTCPLCPKSSKMAPYVMLEHFKNRYGHYVLKEPIFEINTTIDSNNYYLYVTNNMIFMLNVSVDTAQDKIVLDNKLMESERTAKTINQQFRIQDITTELKPCKTTLDGSFVLPMEQIKKQENILCELILKFDVSKSCEAEQNKHKLNHNCDYYKSHYYRKLHLSEEIKKLMPNCKLSACEMFIADGDITYILFCSFCGGDLYPNPYYKYKSCLVPTAGCSSCKNYVKTPCSKGHSVRRCLRNKQDQATFRAYCKWNCGQYFNYSELPIHEVDCISRDPIANCPVQNCPAGSFKNFSELREHFQIHKNTSLNPYYDNQIWFGNIQEKELLYIFQDHVTVVFSRGNESIKLTNVIQNDECKLKIFVNEKQIVLKQRINFCYDDLINFRVLEEHNVTCNDVNV